MEEGISNDLLSTHQRYLFFSEITGQVNRRFVGLYSFCIREVGCYFINACFCWVFSWFILLFLLPQLYFFYLYLLPNCCQFVCPTNRATIGKKSYYIQPTKLLHVTTTTTKWNKWATFVFKKLVNTAVNRFAIRPLLHSLFRYRARDIQTAEMERENEVAIIRETEKVAAATLPLLKGISNRETCRLINANRWTSIYGPVRRRDSKRRQTMGKRYPWYFPGQLSMGCSRTNWSMTVPWATRERAIKISLYLWLLQRW